MCDVEIFTAARAGVAKSTAPSSTEIEANVDMMLAIAGGLGYRPEPGHRVLDFGCGIGATVSSLMTRGVDAYGVDVGEWWGKDHDAYWHDSAVPPAETKARLRSTDEEDYRLPYPDDHFDLIFSCQVFEHVFNYVDVFRELRRVMKPNGLSVHVFPGPGSPYEGHFFIPITFLAKHNWWLKLWSLVRRRHCKSWQDEYQFLREGMRSNNYPRRAQLVADAQAAGAALSFREDVYIEAAKGRPWRVIQAAPMLAPIVHRICQRTMVLTKTTARANGQTVSAG